MPCLPWISYASQKQSEAFHMFLWPFFPSLKQNFIAYRSSIVSSRPDCIFEIPQLWQSDFCRVYSNCCFSCSFEAEIIKIGQSSQFSRVYDNFKCLCKKVWKMIECTMCVCVCVYVYIYIYIGELTLLLSAGAVEYKLTASLQKGVKDLLEFLKYNTKLRWWGSSPGALENVEYLFIAITPRSTLMPECL